MTFFRPTVGDTSSPEGVNLSALVNPIVDIQLKLLNTIPTNEASEQAKDARPGTPGEIDDLPVNATIYYGANIRKFDHIEEIPNHNKPHNTKPPNFTMNSYLNATDHYTSEHNIISVIRYQFAKKGADRSELLLSRTNLKEAFTAPDTHLGHNQSDSGSSGFEIVQSDTKETSDTATRSSSDPNVDKVNLLSSFGSFLSADEGKNSGPDANQDNESRANVTFQVVIGTVAEALVSPNAIDHTPATPPDKTSLYSDEIKFSANKVWQWLKDIPNFSASQKTDWQISQSGDTGARNLPDVPNVLRLNDTFEQPPQEEPLHDEEGNKAALKPDQVTYAEALAILNDYLQKNGPMQPEFQALPENSLGEIDRESLHLLIKQNQARITEASHPTGPDNGTETASVSEQFQQQPHLRNRSASSAENPHPAGPGNARWREDFWRNPQKMENAALITGGVVLALAVGATVGVTVYDVLEPLAELASPDQPGTPAITPHS
jgi:hypothetical protein